MTYRARRGSLPPRSHRAGRFPSTYHGWYNMRMPPSPEPTLPVTRADARLRYLRARLAVLRRAHDELSVIDSRTINGKEDRDDVRLALDVYLMDLDDEITRTRRAVIRAQ